MSDALKKIRIRAKQLQKQSPGKKWTSLIKAASADYRAGKLGKVKKSSNRKTGTSDKRRDKQRSAKTPGKRIVKHRGGKRTKYYERRKNRSDQPGRLTGMSAQNEMYLRRLREANTELSAAEQKLMAMKRHVSTMKAAIEKKLYRKQIKEQQRYIRTIKSNLRMLKTLLRY